MNSVTLMGRLTREPELRQTQNGVSVARFAVAVNRRFKDRDGNYPADFINCIAWRQTAEFISRYFHKGSMICISGTLQSRQWEQNGEKRYGMEVVAESAYFTGERSESAREEYANTQPTGYRNAPRQNSQADDFGYFPDMDFDDDPPF